MTDRYKVKITVLKCFNPFDVFDVSPVTHITPLKTCELFKEDQEFIVAENLRIPKDFCPGAWHSMYCNVRTLAFGGNLPWYKERGVAINACTDGLRPVIFKLERIDT